jgi:hypothetical protein
MDPANQHQQPDVVASAVRVAALGWYHRHGRAGDFGLLSDPPGAMLVPSRRKQEARMADPRERETAERFVEGSREVRKGIEIVVSQGQPADWTPPSASLGPEPESD